MVMTYRELYQNTRQALLQVENSERAGIVARDLICTFSGKTVQAFLLARADAVEPSVCDRVEEGVRRLLNEEPLAYVLGEWEFYGMPLYVTPDVLIPRDDTVAVAELAIRKSLFLDTDPRILDLCCGSGCIGIAIASRVKDARVTLADISKEALAVAKKNVARNKLGGRMSCVHADALGKPSAFLGKFDMVVSNPPYVTASQMQELPRSVNDYEPHLALLGGEDGLDFYREIVKNYTAVLKPGGYLCFEFGMGQGDDVCRILTDSGYTVLERTRDYNDRERAVLAQYGGKGY